MAENKIIGEVKDHSMRKFLWIYDNELVLELEKALKKNPNVEIDNHRMAAFMPFIKKVHPIVSRKQNLLGFTIVCFHPEMEISDEPKVVEYALEPLLAANVIDSNDAQAIKSWFDRTEPQSCSFGHPHFEKTLDIDGHKFTLSTDGWAWHRDLVLYSKTQ